MQNKKLYGFTKPPIRGLCDKLLKRQKAMKIGKASKLKFENNLVVSTSVIYK